MKECDVSYEGRCFSAETLESNGVILDNAKSLVIFEYNNTVIKLTELQRRFMYCLVTGVANKNDIIRNVWPGNHHVISDNSYYQIIFQCRTLLSRHGVPADTIKTIPRFGVMLQQESRDRLAINDDNKGLPPAGRQSRLKAWRDAINYKLAVVLTFIFSTAVLTGISE